MIARRNLLTLFGTGIATGWMGLSQNKSRLNGDALSDEQKVATLSPCIDPPWKHLSSANGAAGSPNLRSTDWQCRG